MKRIVLLSALVAPCLGSAASASECSLEVAGKRHAFQHVEVSRQASAFGDSKDHVIRCFREAIPDQQAGADGSAAFQPASGHLEIRIAASGHVTSVQVRTPELTAGVSGVGFGVRFDGQLDAAGIHGTVTSDEALTSLHDGEQTAPFRVSVTLDRWPANDPAAPGGR